MMKMIKNIIFSLMISGLGSIALSSVALARADVIETEKVAESIIEKKANTTEKIETTQEVITSESKADVPENEIPLRMTAAEKNITEQGAGQKAILSIGVLLALVGVGYYLFKRKVYANKSINSQQMQIKVLTQHYLGPKKSLVIIRVAGETMVIGVTEQNISMLKTLSLLDDELPTTTPDDFQKVMASGFENGENKAVSDRRSVQSNNERSIEVSGSGSNNMRTDLSSDTQENTEDEFAFAGIKTTVFQKIKSMRNIQ